MRTFHNIQIEDYGQGCVTFRDTERGVEIDVLSTCLDGHENRIREVDVSDGESRISVPAIS